MTKITMDGKYQTRDGRPVRVLCVDAEGLQPVVALIGGDVQRFSSSGVYWFDDKSTSYHDLVPVPEKRRVKFWVNVYGNLVYAYNSKDQADRAAAVRD